MPETLVALILVLYLGGVCAVPLVIAYLVDRRDDEEQTL